MSIITTIMIVVIINIITVRITVMLSSNADLIRRPAHSSRDTACLAAPERWLTAKAGYCYRKCLHGYVMGITPSTRL